MSLGVVVCNKVLRRMRLSAIRTAKWPVITMRRHAREFTNIAPQNERSDEMEISHVDFLIAN